MNEFYFKKLNFNEKTHFVKEMQNNRMLKTLFIKPLVGNKTEVRPKVFRHTKSGFEQQRRKPHTVLFEALSDDSL